MSAIRIRCTKCSKRISIDVAFAGGVCRCPYCTAINNVPLAGAAQSGAVDPRDPAAAGSRASKAAPKGKSIPVAGRVPLQGVAAIFLIVAMLAMVVAGIVVVMQLTGGNGEGDDPNGSANGAVIEGTENPFATAAEGAVAGNLRIKAPVVYVVSASASMKAQYAHVAAMIRASMQSLPAGDKAAVVIGMKDKSVVAGSGYVTMPDIGSSIWPVESVGWPEVFDDAPDVADSLARALELEPATIILFARDWVDSGYPVADKAKQKGILIITILPDPEGDQAASMRELAGRTGGPARVYSRRQLSDYAAASGVQP